MDIKKNIDVLREVIEEHNYNYYVLDNPKISDYEFDKLLEKLIRLEKKHPEYYDENSPSQRVGGEINPEFKTVDHVKKMLSLSNTYSSMELIEFDNRIKKKILLPYKYVCELKYDGTSISLSYKDGKFNRATTRGNGIRGDDVTSNVKTIKSIPLKLRNNCKDEFEIRGEIFFNHESFKKLNQERENKNLPLFSNPRNASSGTLKLKDSKEVATRSLDCIFYQVLNINNSNSHYNDIKNCKKIGFKISESMTRVNNIEEVINYCNYWEKERNNLNYDIDGVVIKIDNYDYQNELGFTSKFPKWAISYKFKTKKVKTILKKITYQVGRTGAVTPVANLEPVNILGTLVKRASLHNEEQILKLNLIEGDSVYVEKGGEIIPKIVGVEKRNIGDLFSNNLIYKFIEYCPECNSKLNKIENDSIHYCINHKHCPPQIKGRIEHFISKKCMDIKGLGPEKIDMLIENKLIHNFSDIYDLINKKNKLIGLTKYVNNEISGIKINNHLQVKSDSLLFCLGKYTFTKKICTFIILNFNKLHNLTKSIIYSKISLENQNEIKKNDVKNLLFFLNLNKNLVLKFDKFNGISKKYFTSLNIALDLLNIHYIQDKYEKLNYVDELINSNNSDRINEVFKKISNRNKIVFKDKTIVNLINSIETSKNVEFSRVLFSLGIRHVGETVSLKIANKVKNIDNLINLSFNEIIEIEDVGEEIANSIVKYFDSKANFKIINKLKKIGLNFELKNNENYNKKLNGKNIMITGKFDSFSRDKLKSIIRINGGNNMTSISKNTSFILAGEKMGPKKFEKANKLGIKIIDELTFLNMIK